MGDCGAFGYVDLEEPPYSVEDVLDYYTRHGFDYGISVDHLVFGADDREGQRYRYDLTLENAQEFYDKHQAQGREWVPMAAVQGWNVDSYVQAAQECVAIGYDYLAVGGLVKSTTVEITSVLEAIRDAVANDIRIHALGVARFTSLSDFLRIGVTSVDSATYLRRAWTSRKDNFWTREQQVFSAIRVPGPKRALRAAARKQAKEQAEKRGMSSEEKETYIEEAIEAHLNERLERAKEMEQECFYKLRTYGARAANAPSVYDLVDHLDRYQEYVGRNCLRKHYEATLRARPWEQCDCAICERAGIEVAIFRGNNRNRRRGFHNTRVFYDLLGQVLESGESVKIRRGVKAEPELFGTGVS
jgi:queuine/archaeosine tRNA-ribosyltransferase